MAPERSPGVTETGTAEYAKTRRRRARTPGRRARSPMATTLDPRRHLPHQDRDRTDREPVVLADALGDVMAALTEVDPDLLLVPEPRP